MHRMIPRLAVRLLVAPVSARHLLPVFGAVVLFAVGCSEKEEVATGPSYGEKSPLPEARPEYLFACPLNTPTRLFEVYQPLVDLINSKATDFTLKLESAQNYADFEAKLATRRAHFALANPLQTVRAEQQGYRIFAKMGDDENFRGLILVRRDAQINEPADVRGQPISFPAPTAVAGCLMPKLFLKEQGLDVDTEADARYVGTQESSIMNVFQGLTKAGCTWPPPWESFRTEHPAMAAALVVKWETEPLINNGVVAREDLPEPRVRVVREVLLGLHDHAPGRTILARMSVSRYEPADSATYQTMRDFLTKYEEAFGAMPLP